MAYADLTTEQKRQLQDWLRELVRPIQGEFAKVLNHMEAAKTAHASHVGDVLAVLVDADEGPRVESGLTGAIAVTKAELTTILALLNAVLTTYDTAPNRELWTKFCGAGNLIG